jgi:putative DNA methylase
MTEYKRKLIEVALPLEAINRESAREKSIRHGHPSTLHLWWARRPLAACRAIIFGSLVDDPSANPTRFPTEEDQEAERHRLFQLLEELVKWDNVTNERVLAAAREEIHRSCGEILPPILDPFCGGGSIPLEAQRLGLSSKASDLNPVAVLLTKALVEMPSPYTGRPPVNPNAEAPSLGGWTGAHGLAQDVRHYGRWMRDEAVRRVGHLYPEVELPQEFGSGRATVIAWIWARTVSCPNPACGAEMPLISSMSLSTNPAHPRWLEPIIDQRARTIRFEIGGPSGTPPAAPKTARGANFRCFVCQSNAPDEHIKAEGVAGRMGARLVAMVVAGSGGRVYLPPNPEHEKPCPVTPSWRPSQELADDARNIWCKLYGLTTFDTLFTERQLVLLNAFSDLVAEARDRILDDSKDSGYADAVATYLALSVSKLATFNNSLARWRPGEDKSAPAFGRQAIPMVWDYAEVNPFAGAGGDWLGVISGTASVLERLPCQPQSEVVMQDARQDVAYAAASPMVVCTDPPYYDNIGYADLSDFFYVWLRRMLKDRDPEDFSTLLTPKAQELVAIPYRFGGNKAGAERHFERGLVDAFARMRRVHDHDFPLTLFYAFKQAEENAEDGQIASTGWETMLEALLAAGFSVNGTWPLRTEMKTRMLAMGTGALASSIVLACRPRQSDAGVATRKDFVVALQLEVPSAVRRLQQGGIAPVDLAQAAIGPGIGVFSRYARVIEADGSAMSDGARTHKSGARPCTDRARRRFRRRNPLGRGVVRAVRHEPG